MKKKRNEKNVRRKIVHIVKYAVFIKYGLNKKIMSEFPLVQLITHIKKSYN